MTRHPDPLPSVPDPACVVPADVTGDAYVAAYRRGWDARNAGRGLRWCPWSLTARAEPTRTYAKLWCRAFNDCGRARTRVVAEATRRRDADA